MMRRLFESTVVSAISFFIIGISGLLVIPIIVRNWGIAEFGMMVIARTLLPVGLVGIFDLGASEMSTQVVARARAAKNWELASKQLSVLLLIAILTSLISAILLIIFQPFFQRLFHIDQIHSEGFGLILLATAAANLILFPGLIGEGVLRAFERFPLLRAIDVAAALAYAVGTVIAAWLSSPFEGVALIYLATLVLRSAVVCIEAWQLATAAGFYAGVRAERPLVANTLQHCWIIMQGKILGGLQWTLLPVIVGTLLGPGPVAVYDILTRLPRFAKSVLALLCSSLLPFSVQLEQLDARREMIRLARAGLILLPSITVPPLVGCALLSEPILRLWIGPQVVDYSWWMAAMFGVTIIHQYLSFASIIMLSRPQALKVLNHISLLNVVVMAIVIAATFTSLGERAFILGQTVAWVIVWPIQSLVVARQLRVGGRMLFRVVAVQLILLGPPVLLAVWAPNLLKLSSLPQVAAVLAVWTAAQWFLHYWLILEGPERKEAHRMAGGFFTMWARVLRPVLLK